MAQYVTADSDDGAINVNTAPKMVLRSLAEGISPELADKMDEYRTKEGNDLSGTKWFQDMAGVTIDPELLLTVNSNYFKIISTGQMSNMAKTISGIVKRSSNKSVQIIKWRQD